MAGIGAFTPGHQGPALTRSVLHDALDSGIILVTIHWLLLTSAGAFAVAGQVPPPRDWPVTSHRAMCQTSEGSRPIGSSAEWIYFTGFTETQDLRGRNQYAYSK
jgi:hypothetical protein